MMTKENNKKTKWVLLSIIPVVAIPSVALASVYGVRHKENENKKISVLSDSEIDSILAKEASEIYSNYELNEKGENVKLAIEKVKREVKENDIVINVQKLREMLAYEINLIETMIQSTIQDKIDKTISENNRRDIEELYVAYQESLQKLGDVEKPKLVVSRDLLKEDWWIANKVIKNKVVPKDEIKYREQLVNLIEDVEEQIQYWKILQEAMERCKYIKFVNKEKEKYFKTGELNPNIANIPQSVERIPDGLFEGVKFDRLVMIPKWVKYIGKRAFKNASLLKGIQISKSVIEIEDEAFMNAKLDDTFRIPPTLQKLGDRVFENTTLPFGFEYHTFLGKVTEKLKDAIPENGIWVKGIVRSTARDTIKKLDISKTRNLILTDRSKPFELKQNKQDE